MKRAKKVNLISVHDHPASHYAAHWMLFVQGDDVTGWRWAAVLDAYEVQGWLYHGAVTRDRPNVDWPKYPPDLPRGATQEQQDAYTAIVNAEFAKAPRPVYTLDKADWSAPLATKDEADTAAQKWALERMSKHRKAVVPMSDGEVAALVAEFDLRRQLKDFGRLDQIRGLLKADGVGLEEPASVSDITPTRWRR